MTDCYKKVVSGCIERFGTLPEMCENGLETRIVILLKDSSNVFVVNNVDNDTIMPEIALFCEGDNVEIKGFQVSGERDFLVTKLSNITLSERLSKTIEVRGHSDGIYKVRNLNLVDEEVK